MERIKGKVIETAKTAIFRGWPDTDDHVTEPDDPTPQEAGAVAAGSALFVYALRR
jgi:hypothetical protein